MLSFLITAIIWLLVAGFIYWAVGAIVALIPMPPLFKQVIDVLLLIIVVAIILFYIVIPLLHMLTGISINLPH